ncbi:uncharacterized protein LOC110820641 isoform X1 [Carica papaya]|uniref:uncharacterized protein LOC110820641 isoform X1 n=1 Tax=Carica papaya TaxID=3649 RepID=UPI000B8CCE8C|nr:uncharacterized protein LOC110820641 isoform X1 [Carica papaya]
MDWAFVHKTWDKWVSTSVGSSGQPLKAALLINYDPTGPSRLLSTIAEQEEIKLSPVELTQFVDFVKCSKLQTESFIIGANQYSASRDVHEPRKAGWGRCNCYADCSILVGCTVSASLNFFFFSVNFRRLLMTGTSEF